METVNKLETKQNKKQKEKNLLVNIFFFGIICMYDFDIDIIFILTIVYLTNQSFAKFLSMI